MAIRKQKTSVSLTYVEELYQNLAAQRNQVAAKVRALETKLAEKSRELRPPDDAMKALKKPGSRR